MKNKKMKNNKGITLIALIITIIVLAILIGVVITAVNKEIFERTLKAKADYNFTAGKEEVEMLAEGLANDIFSGDVDEDNLGDYIAKQLDGQKVRDCDITTTGRVVALSVDDQIVTGLIKDDGTIDWDIGWTIIEIENNLVITNGKTTLGIGDYVRYYPEDGAKNYTVTSSKEKNGYGNQTFSVYSLGKSSGNGWRIFGFDEETQQILLISDTAIGSEDNNGYYLKGKNGYKNGSDELNKICALYGQGKYATGGRCITIDDVNNYTGYIPEEENQKFYEGYSYGNEVTFSWLGDNNVYPENKYIKQRSYYDYNSGTSYDETTVYEDEVYAPHENGFNWFNEETSEWENSPVIGEQLDSKQEIVKLKSSYYNYSNSISSNISALLFLDGDFESDGRYVGDRGRGFHNTSGGILRYVPDTEGENVEGRDFSDTTFNYWLASDVVSPMEEGVYYGLHYVSDTNVLSNGLYFSNDYDYYFNFGIRPIVSLQNNIEFEQDAVSEEWILVEK